MRKLVYDLYEEDKKILEQKTAKEIREFLQLPGIKMADYTKKKRKVKGKYTITIAGEAVKDSEIMKARRPSMENEFWEEWQHWCNMFQNVIWVQQWEPGVKRLQLVCNTGYKGNPIRDYWNNGCFDCIRTKKYPEEETFNCYGCERQDNCEYCVNAFSELCSRCQNGEQFREKVKREMLR